MSFHELHWEIRYVGNIWATCRYLYLGNYLWTESHPRTILARVRKSYTGINKYLDEQWVNQCWCSICYVLKPWKTVCYEDINLFHSVSSSLIFIRKFLLSKMSPWRKSVISYLRGQVSGILCQHFFFKGKSYYQNLRHLLQWWKKPKTIFKWLVVYITLVNILILFRRT